MKLTIIAVGRMKSGPETELFARYADRTAKAGRQLEEWLDEANSLVRPVTVPTLASGSKAMDS